MSAIDRLAETKIRDAMARGVFDNLPGAGKPLNLDDTSLIPPHLRAGYRLLKNAGCLPPELETLKAVRAAAERVRCIQDPERRLKEQKRLRLLELQLSESLRR